MTMLARAIAAALLLAVGAVWPVAAQETIKIGLIDPLTGGASFYGQSLQRGVQLAFEEANAKGGVLGKKLELISEDDRCVPADGTSAAIKLITRDNVVTILGTFCSSVSLAVGDVVRRYGVPQIITSAVADAITDKNEPNKGWVFRASSRSSDQAVSIVHYFAEIRKAKTVAILEENTDYGVGCGEEIRKEAARRNLKVLTSERYNQGETNFYSVITKLRGLAPEAVSICGLVTEGAQILRQAKDLGLKTTFMGSTAFNNDKLLELAGAAAEGVVANATFEATSKRAVARDFAEKYRASSATSRSTRPPRATTPASCWSTRSSAPAAPSATRSGRRAGGDAELQPGGVRPADVR